MTTVARGLCLTAFSVALVCGVERDRGRQDRSRVARRELALDGRLVSPCRATSRVCLCYRVFGFLGQPIEFHLEHKAVGFEREIIAFPRHEHRLSIEKQTP
jgi:hypothetical protein